MEKNTKAAPIPSKLLVGEVKLYSPEVLRKCDLFSGLGADQLSNVEKICTTEEFEAGAILCQQGALAKKLYVIKDGWAQIFLGVKPLPKCHLQTASTYEVVGWEVMLEPHVYKATVKAIEKTTAFAFDGERLQQLCHKRPDIGYEISLGLLRVIAERLQLTYTKLVDYTSWIRRMEESSVLE
ncbi:cyclic nucleotide-binding domain-containing protein [Bacteroidota bacterium]